MHSGAMTFRRGLTFEERWDWDVVFHGALLGGHTPLGHVGTPGGRVIVFPSAVTRHEHCLARVWPVGGPGRLRLVTVVLRLLDPRERCHTVCQWLKPYQRGVM